MLEEMLWCRARVEEEELVWRALLLRERCLLRPPERARDSSSLICAPLPSRAVIVRALSRGISSTGTRTVRRVAASSEFERRESTENLFLLCTEFEARRLHAAKLSFAASPVNPRVASHSVNMGCHLL